MSRRIATALIAALLAVATSACGAEESRPSASSRSTGSPATTAADAGFELLDAGGADKAVLELSPREGDVLNASMRIHMKMGMGGQRMEAPEMTMPMVSRVLEVDGDEITAKVEYGRPTVAPGPGSEELAESLRTMDGLTATMTLARSGRIIDSDIDIPEGMAPQMAAMVQQMEQQLQSMVTPMPLEPVGVGARWRVRSVIEMSGLRVRQTSTVRLVSHKGDDYALETGVELDFLPGAVEGAGDVEIVGGSAKGSGTANGSLRSIMALVSNGTMSQRVTMKSQGEKSEMTMEMTMVMRSKRGQLG